MSKFEVNVVRIDDVTDHPDADRLSLNRIGGFVAVSNKEVSHAQGEAPEFVHRYQPGQLVVYVPEGAVVPLEVLHQFGYTDAEGKGILAGSKGNRVKAIKLRGVVSQGLIFPLTPDGKLKITVTTDAVAAGRTPDELHSVVEGQDVADLLSIVKYEPEIPASMNGDVMYAPALTLKFDLENVQKYPDVFDPDEEVYVTEKIHGTFAGFVFIDKSFADANEIDVADLLPFGNKYYATAYSKGLGEKGLVFRVTPENEAKNLYLRALKNLLSDLKIEQFITMNVDYLAGKVTVLGEVYGKGVQDLTYGKDRPTFAAFNLADSNGVFMPSKAFFQLDGFEGTHGERVPLPKVPLIAVCNYRDVLDRLEIFRDGLSFVDDDGLTIREGCVVVPTYEGRDDRIGRRALKFVSPAYLTRKGNTTEYQ